MKTSNPSFARKRARRAFSLTIALSLVGLFVAANASAVPRNVFGVMPQKGLSVSDIEHMGEAKVGTLRFGLDWSGIDPSPAAGDYNFAHIDALVGEAAKQNIRLIAILATTPVWVAKDIEGSNCRAQGGGTDCAPFAPQTKAGLAAWKTFVTDVAERYGPNGEFWQQNPSIPHKPIRVWQVWNEQNSDRFYRPKPNAGKYAKLLVNAHDALASVDSGAEVLLGGMFRSPGGGRKPSIFSEKFLAQLYRIKGIKRYFDGVSIHPYAASVTKVKLQVDLMREAMVDARDSKADVWITEMGWASSGPKNPLVRGPKGQAKRLKEAFDYFLSQRRKLNLRVIIWYSWEDNRDPEVGLCEWCAGSGLLTENGKEKPSYRAFVRYTGGK